MSTMVLVAGAWLGGWAWERVTPELVAAGHDVHPLTLTGLGDRAHLSSPEITLSTHVADIVSAGHWPMATKPAELAALLSRIATGVR